MFLKPKQFIILSPLILYCILVRPGLTEDFPTNSATVPAPRTVISDLVARSIVPEDAFRQFNIREGQIGEHHRPTPLGELPLATSALTTAPQAAASNVITTSNLAASDIEFIANRGLLDSETNDITSSVNEPSIAVRGDDILYTGNWFAAFSNDGGANFSYLNPATTFPAIPNQPFCCDQVALYDHQNDVMFWFMQHVRDNAGNTIRLAVAQGDDITNQQWRFYDFTPQGVGNWSEEWFDYPDLAVGEQFLYITSNVFSIAGGFTRAVILRLSLAQLAGYQPLTFNYFNTTQFGSLRPTQGATDSMYFGTHLSRNTLRVFSWPESSTTISSDDVGIDIWSNSVRVAPGPDGRDWLGRADPRITAAWSSGDSVGFAWTASQDSSFPFPHVRVAILDEATKALVAQPHIWNSNFAFAYPFAAPNDAGTVGISLHYGGGSTFFPSHAVGVLQAASASSFSWQLVTSVNGTDGPSTNRWGDYQAVRQHGQQPATWVATGFTLQGGTERTDIEPRYLHFRLTETQTVKDGYQYAAKIVCGLQKDPSELRLTRGLYATAINIHNPSDEPAKFSKTLALTFPPDEQKPGELMPIATDELPPDHALEVDCIDIQRRLFPSGFPSAYIKGFVIIQSPDHELNVTAVYTSASLSEDGQMLEQSGIDVEQIHGRIVQ